ncbi:hypothetical protein FRB93_006236 [Tulasnella sp. JGI-2019a]|nr:hypothetical protein FRB93_006236 [Tulasnella sp. JGI-2019a]
MGGSTIPAWVNLVNDLIYKASVGMLDLFRDKQRVKSYNGSDSPFSLAFGTEKAWWDWIQVVDGGRRVPNFMKAMDLTNSLIMVNLLTSECVQILTKYFPASRRTSASTHGLT